MSQNIFIAVWLLAAEQRINPLPQGYQEGHLKIHIQDGSCPFWQKIAEFIFWYTWALNCYLILEMDWDIITDSWAPLPIESAGRTWYRAAVLSGVTSCCKNKVETRCPSFSMWYVNWLLLLKLYQSVAFIQHSWQQIISRLWIVG